MKRFLCVALLCALLCSLLAPGVLADAALEGKPWTNSNLPGNLPAEQPGPEQNYDLYVNWDRYAQTAGANVAGSMTAQADRDLKDAVWQLIDQGDTVEARLLRRMTGLILDRDRREQQGRQPLETYLQRVREVQTLEALSALQREDAFLFSSPYADIRLSRSHTEPATFVLGINPAVWVGYLVQSEDSPSVSEELPGRDLQSVTEDLLLLGGTREEAEKMAARIGKLQDDCEQYGLQTDAEDPGSQLLTLAQVRQLCVPLYDQLVSQGLAAEDDQAVYAFETTSVFQGLQSNYTEENLDLFKALICRSLFRAAAEDLDPASWGALRGVSGADMNLRDAAWEYLQGRGRVIAEQAWTKAFLPSEKQEVLHTLARECLQAMEDRLQRCSWVSEASRARLVERVSSMSIIMIGDGEKIDFEPLLALLEDENLTLLEAAVRVDQFIRRSMLRLTGKPYDPTQRLLIDDSLLKTDAIYTSAGNQILIMAGVLREGLCDDSSREALLATIGQTIGHEISHGFDAQHTLTLTSSGAPLLEEADQQQFKEKVIRLKEFLDTIELADGIFLKGEQVIGEMMADLGGMSIILDLARKEESFDYDAFFRAYALKFFHPFPTRKDAMEYFESNSHPAPVVRINTDIACFEEFYRAYPSAVEGTPMYIPPESRLLIW